MTRDSEVPARSAPEGRSRLWLHRLGGLGLSLGLGLLLFTPASCNLCGTSCSDGVGCEGREPDRCGEVRGCLVAEPSCRCVDASAPCSTAASCDGKDESTCAAAAEAGCSWRARCYRPEPCETLHGDEDVCRAAGCVPHAECG